ncbi:hypothetical protein NEOLEDRAFT_901573 [Neolentinus lepideus HHB14362 ss-1]|uniref:Uncharacterized protein n=1 Tax=Neolentinus lepideus HHB14362 ss-1 TaxID=1314782 RepID=A0A165NQ05_9AGAM|nr:hypothetical protein NEOLEDRAFT_901573 [Neolentinus lepideus HHB14362 ss-1]
MSSPILVPLNQTTLLFLPSSDFQTGTVVQVYIRPARDTTVETLAAFYLAQDEISGLILRLVASLSPSLSSPLSIEIDGPTYSLRADRKKWKIAQHLKLKWGEETVSPASHKWVFTFAPKTGGGNPGRLRQG